METTGTRGTTVATDPVGARNGMVWVDGIDRYVTRAAAYAFQAMGHNVQWDTEEPDPDQEAKNRPLQYKDN